MFTSGRKCERCLVCLMQSLMSMEDEAKWSNGTRKTFAYNLVSSKLTILTILRTFLALPTLIRASAPRNDFVTLLGETKCIV